MNGQSGAVIHVLESPSDPVVDGRFGDSVARLDDATGDGIPEILIGAPGETAGGHLGAGLAYVFDGQWGTPLYVFSSPNAQSAGSFGNSVVQGGDLNDDGFVDVLVGASNEDVNDFPDAGRVYAFSGSVVPVELSLFAADIIDDGILIRWRTKTEENCYGFHIYRQRSGEPERICVTEEIIPGNGTTAVPHDYEYTDRVRRGGTYRYWLEEVASSGDLTEYGPINVTKPSAMLSLGSPYPNPVHDEVELRVTIPDDMSGKTLLRLFDHYGRQISETVLLGFQGDRVVRWSASDTNTQPGVYLWQLENGDRKLTRPMIVLR
jgi:hypothetical protein